MTKKRSEEVFVDPKNTEKWETAIDSWIEGSVPLIQVVHNSQSKDVMASKFHVPAGESPACYVETLVRMCRKPFPPEIMGYFVPEPILQKNLKGILELVTSGFLAGDFEGCVNDPVYFLKEMTSHAWPWEGMFRSLREWIERNEFVSERQIIGCVEGIYSLHCNGVGDQAKALRGHAPLAETIRRRVMELHAGGNVPASALYLFIILERSGDLELQANRSWLGEMLRDFPLNQKDESYKEMTIALARLLLRHRKLPKILAKIRNFGTLAPLASDIVNWTRELVDDYKYVLPALIIDKFPDLFASKYFSNNMTGTVRALMEKTNFLELLVQRGYLENLTTLYKTVLRFDGHLALSAQKQEFLVKVREFYGAPAS
jgi:hypothetical protein